jgi:mRNA interferase YafQ
MYEIRFTTRFKKDYKTAVRRGYDIGLLRQVIELLAAGKKLP